MGLFDFFRKPKENFTEQEFSCTRDGLTIRGTEYRPEGENLPIAIVSHGFMDYQGSVKHYTKALARLGYAAFCFDFCGGSVAKGKSDGATTDMSVLTEVKDQEAVIAYTRSLPYTSDEVILVGCSQGGFVSGLSAARNPDVVKKLVMFYPALCIPDHARAGQMMFAKFDPHNIPEKIHCGPMLLGRCYPADVIEMDAIAEISKYPGPVLIIHGTNDSIVPTEYSVRAQKAYPNAKLHIIQDGAHGFNKKHDAEAINVMTDFAKRTLSSPPEIA